MMANISRDPKGSIRAELDDLHKGMVVDLDRRISAIQVAELPKAPDAREFEETSDIISLVTETITSLRHAYSEVERLEGERAACVASIEELRATRLSLSNKNDEQSATIKSMQQQNENLAGEIRQLKASLASLGEERDAFAQNLSEAERILRRNLAELRYKVE